MPLLYKLKDMYKVFTAMFLLLLLIAFSWSKGIDKSDHSKPDEMF